MDINDSTNESSPPLTSNQRNRSQRNFNYPPLRDLQSKSEINSFRAMVGSNGSGSARRSVTDASLAEHGAVGADVGPRSPSIVTPSTSSTVVLAKRTSGHSLKQSWRLKYQDFLPEKNSKPETFQKLVDRANEWLQRTPEIQVRSCETVTWSSHDAKRIADGEQMLLTQNIEENGVTHCVRGLRLWLAPSAFGKTQTIYFTDFMPTATNDIRSLVVKVNRKITQNQLTGEIIRVETFTVPHVKGQLDSGITRWSENSVDDKLYVFSLRVFTSRMEGRAGYSVLRPVSLELKDFIPQPLDGDSYEGFETLTERANGWLKDQEHIVQWLKDQEHIVQWLKDQEHIVHVSFQSVLVQKGDGPHGEISSSCRFSVPGTNSSRFMEVFRILRIIVLTTGNAVAVERKLAPDPFTFRPFVYDIFTPELIRKRSLTSNGNGQTTDKMETMKDTFSKVMAFLKNTGAEVICAETIINPIQYNWQGEQLLQSSPDVVPFLMTISVRHPKGNYALGTISTPQNIFGNFMLLVLATRQMDSVTATTVVGYVTLFLIGRIPSRVPRSTIRRRGSGNPGLNPGSNCADGMDTPCADSDVVGAGSVGVGRPLFLGSVVSHRFKYRWLILALFGFSGMTVIVVLSVIYSNQTYN